MGTASILFVRAVNGQTRTGSRRFRWVRWCGWGERGETRGPAVVAAETVNKSSRRRRFRKPIRS